MQNFLHKIFNKGRIEPEVIIALRGRIPDSLDVVIKNSEDNGYWVDIKNLPGCFTQAENGKELFEMVNDAVYTHLDVPKKYVPFMPTFFPPEEVRKKFEIKIPSSFLEKNIILQRT